MFSVEDISTKIQQVKMGQVMLCCCCTRFSGHAELLPNPEIISLITVDIASIAEFHGLIERGLRSTRVGSCQDPSHAAIWRREMGCSPGSILPG
jgi:hypothetical protein